MKVGDVVQYGLYAVTVALGIALIAWLIRSRKAREQQERDLRRARAFASGSGSGSKSEGARVRAIRGVSQQVSMAEALAGIRLPVHWQPDPPVEVQSPFTLTTNKDSAGDMAETLTTELARIGYRIKPTGTASASAERNGNKLSIEVEADETGSFVSSRIVLIGPADG